MTPLTKYFCKKGYTHIIGSVKITRKAIFSDSGVVVNATPAWLNCRIPLDSSMELSYDDAAIMSRSNVAAVNKSRRLDTNIAPVNQSFQLLTPIKSAMVAIAGVESGSMI